MSFKSQSSSDGEQDYQRQQPPPNAGYPAYGNPPQGYPPQGYPPQQQAYAPQYPVQGYSQPPPPPPQPQPQIIYTQAPPPQPQKHQRQHQQSAGCLTGCLAAIGCCFIIEYCCMPYD